MVRPDRDRIGAQWPVEIDETYVGAATRGKGRGVHDMAIVVGAVEARKQVCERRKRHIAAGRLRLRLVPDRSGKVLTKFVADNIEKRSHVTTDGWQGYDRLDALGYDHDSLALGGDPVNAELALPTIHQVFANLKVWLNVTHHGVSDRHLQAYLDEYVFRFNRRFYPMTAFRSVLGIGTQVAGQSYAALYDRSRKHSRRSGVPANHHG
jgi:transposase-like protein